MSIELLTYFLKENTKRLDPISYAGDVTVSTIKNATQSIEDSILLGSCLVALGLSSRAFSCVPLDKFGALLYEGYKRFNDYENKDHLCELIRIINPFYPETILIFGCSTLNVSNMELMEAIEFIIDNVDKYQHLKKCLKSSLIHSNVWFNHFTKPLSRAEIINISNDNSIVLFGG